MLGYALLRLDGDCSRYHRAKWGMLVLRIVGASTTRRAGRWPAAACLVLLSTALAGCTSEALPSSAPLLATTTPTAVTPTASTAPTSPPSPTAKPSVSGETIIDSFGNADYYITVADDALALVAEAYGFSEAKLAGFNGLQPGAVLAPGTKLRLMPEGPGIGASGAAVVDTAGIPTSYTIEHDDTLAGITYRFNVTADQLAEANKVPFVQEQGNVYFVREGRTIQLQKNPVDSRSGRGQAVENSWGTTVFYTTVDGDSFDSLGYQFRVGTAEILQYNPSLVETEPIPAGTKLRLIAGDLPVEGARGTYTADANGIPLTYTTVAGDTEVQVAARFGVTILSDANRPTSGGGGVWYQYTHVPSGELAAGQTISVSLDQPINKTGLDS